MANIRDIPRGDSRPYKFDFGAGVDITGWKIYFTVKENKDDTDADAVLQVISTAGDDATDDVSNGTMTLWLESDVSVALVPDVKYFYGFQRVIAGTPPKVKTLTTGTFKALQDITISIT